VSSGSNAGPALPPLARSKTFWRLLRNALIFGVVLAFAGLAFLGVTQGGDLWFDPGDNGWLGGELWWVAVTAGAGVLVGLLRRAFAMPEHQAGLIKELEAERVEPSTVPGTVTVSAVSLVGGASLGPEAALGSMGGGLGTWISERRKDDEATQRTNTLTGMSGAYGGLLASPFLATMLVIELARPAGARFLNTLFAGLVAASVSFAIFFPIAGATFLGLYELPPYEYEDWHLLAGAALGLVAAALAIILALAVGLLRRATAPLEGRTVLRPTLGGIAFGLVAVAFPLTLFTGTDQLTTVIDDRAALGAGLLIAVVLAKILTFALSMSTGFIGGPFFPMLFIGGTAGVAAHLLVPGLPLALAFTCLFAALPGALVAAPFTLVLLAALTTQVGALQTAPIGIAVLTAYVAVSGSGVLLEMARRGAAAEAD
jgi:H+/Cl- antiporter ClcA